MRTDNDYIKKLSAIGIENVKANDLIHPDKTIVTYLKKNPKYKELFTIAGPIIKKALNDNGYLLDDKVRRY